MRIIDIPEFQDKQDILTCEGSSTVFAASKKMKERKTGAILVVDKKEKLIGIFTERDILNKVVAAKKDPAKITLKDVMTKDVKTAHIKDSIPESMRRMSQGRFRHLPVVDDDDMLLGIVSQGDFVALTWFDLWRRFKTKTKNYFLSFTQVWMIVIAIVLYTFAVLVLSH